MAGTTRTPMTAERLAEIRDLLRYESSIAFYSSRAKESMLLLVEEAEDAARLREQNAELDKTCDEVMRERDHMHEVADKLAYAIAPMEWIGEHSSGNDPWENALDHVTAEPDVEKLRGELATRPTRAEAYRHVADELRLLQSAEPDHPHAAGLYAAELRARRMADAA